MVQGQGRRSGRVGMEMNGAGAAAKAQGRPADQAGTADYIAELSGELANLARQNGLDALGYILDMARLEAENATRHVSGRR